MSLLKNLYIKLALLFLLVTSTCSGVLAQGLNPQHQKLDKYLTALNDNDKIMTAVYISKNGRVLYEHYSGLASVENKVSITADTKFRIGSITKTFTAVLVMQLIEEGKLALDTKLSNFYPNIPNAQRITIKQLLSHRSGIKSYTSETEYLKYMTKPQLRKQIEQRIESYKSLFEPNSKHQYSNSNYTLLGYIIESLYQKSYAEVLSQKISNPLKLDNTYYGNSIEIEDKEAFSYRFEGSWTRQPATHMSVPHAAGAIVSTTKETNLFLAALFDKKLLNQDSLNAMMQLEDGYGLGLFAMPFYQQKFYGHNGSIDGFRSAAGHNLADGITITVLSNGVNYNFNDVLIALLSSVYQRSFEIPDFSTQPVGLSPATLKQHLGTFSSKDLHLDISFTIANKQLFAQATGQGKLPLTPYSQTEFRFDQAGIVIQFDPQSLDDGKFNRFILNQGGGKFRYTRDE
ncbi:beta-lactamase family protein [Aliiglaciecola sp.]|nr:beta-lactamase family protein [Aliiglaciecola sp.]